MDLGVDFFLRIDCLSPDQHPAWTSGGGLMVGEGMIMVQDGERVHEFQDSQHVKVVKRWRCCYVRCGVWALHVNLPTIATYVVRSVPGLEG